MSFITTLYDEIYSIITTNFPTRLELKNAYDIRNNIDQQLKNGYGVQFLGLSNTNEINNGFRVYTREIIVTFTGQIISTEMNTTPKKVVEKKLLEDQKILIEKILTNKNIVSNVVQLEITDDDGIEMVYDEQKNFAMIKTRIDAKFYLDLTCL